MQTCYNCNNSFMCPCIYQPGNQRKKCQQTNTFPRSMTIDGKSIHLCSNNCVKYVPPTPAKIAEKKLEIPAEAYELYEKAKNSLIGAAPLPSPDQWMTSVTKKMKAAWRELDIKEKNELTDYMNFMYDLTARKY